MATEAAADQVDWARMKFAVHHLMLQQADQVAQLPPVLWLKAFGVSDGAEPTVAIDWRVRLTAHRLKRTAR